MAELGFEVTGAIPERYVAQPTLSLALRITEASGRAVQALALRTQVCIEPQRRRYSPEEEEQLYELFGETRQWGESLRPFTWTQVATTVGRFTGETTVALPIVCTYDFEVAAARYLHGLDAGEIPLVLLFNGTAFFTGAAGLQAEPVPWHLESRFRLAVSVFRDVMDQCFPDSGWLRLSRETLRALERLKTRAGLATAEQAVESLLKASGADRR